MLELAFAFQPIFSNSSYINYKLSIQYTKNQQDNKIFMESSRSMRGMVPQQLLYAINIAVVPHEAHFADLQHKEYNCFICHEKKPIGNSAPFLFMKSKCGKDYHLNCLKKHFEEQKKCPYCNKLNCISKTEVNYFDFARQFYTEYKGLIYIIPVHMIGKIFHYKMDLDLMWDMKQVMRWISMNKYQQNQPYSFPKQKKINMFMKISRDPLLIQAILVSGKTAAYYPTKLYQHFDNLCLLEKVAPSIFKQVETSKELITDTKLIKAVAHIVYEAKDNSFSRLLAAYNLPKMALDAKKGICPHLSQIIYQIFTNKLVSLIEYKAEQKIFYAFLSHQMQGYFGKYLQESKQPSMIQSEIVTSSVTQQIGYNYHTASTISPVKWGSITVNKDVPFQLLKLNGWLIYPTQEEKTLGIILRVYGGSKKQKGGKDINFEGPFTSQVFTDLDKKLADHGYGVAYLNLSDHQLNSASQENISLKTLNQLQADILEFIRHLKKNELQIPNRMLSKSIFIFGHEFGGLLITHLLVNKNANDGKIDGAIIWNGLLSLTQHDQWKNRNFDKNLDPSTHTDFVVGNVLLIQSGCDWNIRPRVSYDFVAKTIHNNQVNVYPYLIPSQSSQQPDEILGPLINMVPVKGEKLHHLILKFLHTPSGLMDLPQKKRRIKIMRDYGLICIDPQSPIGKNITLIQYMQGMMRVFYEGSTNIAQNRLGCYYKSKIISTVIKIAEGVWQFSINHKIFTQAKGMFGIKDVYNRKKFSTKDFHEKFMNQLCDERMQIWETLLQSGEPAYLSIEEMKRIIESKKSQYSCTKGLLINALSSTMVNNHWIEMSKEQHTFVYQKCRASVDEYHKFEEQARKAKKKLGEW